MQRRLTSVVAIALLMAACGSNEEQAPGASAVDSGATLPQADAGQSATTPDTSTAPACEYPSGPYGTETGDVVANLEFDSFADADYLCKPSVAMKMDLTTTRKISFKDYYCNTTCPDKKKRLLWVIVSAGWCGPCQEEVAATQEQYAKGAVDPRVHVIDIVYETDKGAPVTEAFAKLWADNNLFSLSMPVAMDPDFNMVAYFDRDAVPFNMLVDLETMRIIFRQTGSNLPAVGQALHEYLLDK